MDTEIYKIRLEQWRKLIYEANTCGMKKTEWCRQNGVTTKQFYYWQKKIRALALEEMHEGIGTNDSVHGDNQAAQLPSFVELKPPAQSRNPSYTRTVNASGDMPDAPLMLHFKDYRLEIHGNAPESALRMVLKVLQDA